MADGGEIQLNSIQQQHVSVLLRQQLVLVSLYADVRVVLMDPVCRYVVQTKKKRIVDYLVDLHAAPHHHSLPARGRTDVFDFALACFIKRIANRSTRADASYSNPRHTSEQLHAQMVQLEAIKSWVVQNREAIENTPVLDPDNFNRVVLGGTFGNTAQFCDILFWQQNKSLRAEPFPVEWIVKMSV